MCFVPKQGSKRAALLPAPLAGPGRLQQRKPGGLSGRNVRFGMHDKCLSCKGCRVELIAERTDPIWLWKKFRAVHKEEAPKGSLLCGVLAVCARSQNVRFIPGLTQSRFARSGPKDAIRASQ